MRLRKRRLGLLGLALFSQWPTDDVTAADWMGLAGGVPVPAALGVLPIGQDIRAGISIIDWIVIVAYALARIGHSARREGWRMAIEPSNGCGNADSRLREHETDFLGVWDRVKKEILGSCGQISPVVKRRRKESTLGFEDLRYARSGPARCRRSKRWTKSFR